MKLDVKTIKALMDGYGEVDEASARADAMRAMRKGKKEVDPADVDIDASDADIKAASKNILAQMRKAVSLGGRFDVEFLDKKKVRVKPAIANAFIKKYEGMRKPADKEKFQNQAMKSYKDMLKVLKAGYMMKAAYEEVDLDEAKMTFGTKRIPDAMKKKGMSAEEIAKKMKLDVKTIKALMAGYGETYEVDESARSDAMRAMRRGKEVDPADVDRDASDADVKAASKNILAQMRKASNLGGRFEVEFGDKKKVKIKPAIANAFIKKYEDMRKPADKEKFQNQAMKSYKDMLKVLKAGYMMKAGYYNEETILERIDRKLKERKNG